MRTDGVKFSVQKSTKSWIGAGMSGEGLLQTFEGTGRVWLAPTQSIYEHILNEYAVQTMVQSEGSSNTRT